MFSFVGQFNALEKKESKEFNSPKPHKGIEKPEPASLKLKTIYMLYSEDNEAHINFTAALATFLKVSSIFGNLKKSL